MKRLALVVLLFTLYAGSAFAQGCAMCGTASDAASQRSRQALRRAVTVLAVPAVTLLVGFVGVAFWYRRNEE